MQFLGSPFPGALPRMKFLSTWLEKENAIKTSMALLDLKEKPSDQTVRFFKTQIPKVVSFMGNY
jgi:hypothetical protein